MSKFSSSIKLLVGSLTMVSAISGAAVVAEMNSSVEEQAVEQSQTVATKSQQTIVDVATSAGSFDTLVAALEAADLVDVLKGEGPFTVFAPTDEAFAALPEGTLEYLLQPENKEELVSILTYHVVSGSVMSTDLESGAVTTVEGSDVEIQLGEEVKVNDAQVVTADIEAGNGVIHVIDKVIIPAK
ncbi:secreted/surface protein with fasciclin-like repeats [Xenococcus sp. PCC 7305]|uniref:fasciclin domain-containing protein n=1 Tax=Xenococcus sp. PCC 7305 TaxID=102125 RepID=UPI0002AC4678|nr:fasciclin domain-containing protein [Xenococcus sp. PCC 7305]ELS04374.1 secreted/surface protein with fasciclin-like repeats [Xenococcus sp. PCC 7305]